MEIGEAPECLADDRKYHLIYTFVCLAYAIPSLVFHVLVMMVIQRQRTSFSPVYVHIFTLSSIFSIGCWIGDLIFTRIFSLAFVCPYVSQLSGTYYLSIPYFLYNFFPVAYLISAIIIAMHQFTVIVLPLRVIRIWKKSRRRITTATMLISSLAACHILLGTTIIIPMYSGQLYIKILHFYFTNFDSEAITAPAVNAISGVTAAVAILAVTVISISTALKMRNKNYINYKTFLMSCWIGISSVIFAIYQISLWYARFILRNDSAIDDVIMFRGYVADLCFLPLPWVVIIAKRPVRAALFNVFQRKASVHTHISVHI